MITDKRSNETLNGTMIKDKNDVIHDLANLVTQRCVIDTGDTTYMAVHTRIGSYKFWVANHGQECSSWELAQYIRQKYPSRKNPVITVHMF